MTDSAPDDPPEHAPRSAGVAGRLDALGRRLDGLGRRLDGLGRRLDELERRLNDRLPGPLKVGAGVLYCYSPGGRDRLDRLADSGHWDRWHDLAIVLLVALQLFGLAIVAAAAWIGLSRSQATALNDPVNTVAIPGVNEFMPLAAAPAIVFALVAATVVHEAGHAIACRRADVPVTEWGVALLFGFLPLAAYVLPGDELDAASRRTKLRVYAAGVANNLVLALLAFLVLLAPFTASPLDAFVTYFGWAAAGTAPPVAATIADLGLLTNLAFWTALLNANFGLLNALPVSIMDGGRVLALSLVGVGERFDRPLSAGTRSLVVDAVGVLTVVGVLLAIFGPHLAV